MCLKTGCCLSAASQHPGIESGPRNEFSAGERCTKAYRFYIYLTLCGWISCTCPPAGGVCQTAFFKRVEIDHSAVLLRVNATGEGSRDVFLPLRSQTARTSSVSASQTARAARPTPGDASGVRTGSVYLPRATVPW